MAKINPYLNFNGNCEEAFNFYKSVFGGEFLDFDRFNSAPAEDQVPGVDGELIMHVSLPIGENDILMGSDSPEAMGGVTPGTNCHISLQTEGAEETDKLFNGLSAVGKITMPLEETFWGARFGMFVDKFGIPWMVNQAGGATE